MAGSFHIQLVISSCSLQSREDKTNAMPYFLRSPGILQTCIEKTVQILSTPSPWQFINGVNDVRKRGEFAEHRIRIESDWCAAVRHDDEYHSEIVFGLMQQQVEVFAVL